MVSFESSRNEIRPSSASSIADVERVIEELSTAPPDAHLVLPRKLDERSVGGTSAQLQMVVTWRRQCPDGRLCAYVNESDNEGQREGSVTNLIAKSDHGYFAWELAGQLDTRLGQSSLNDLAGPIAEHRRADMAAVETSKRGRKVMLLCVDGRRAHYPRTLYQPGRGRPQVVASASFQHLAQDLQHAITFGPDTRQAGDHLAAREMAKLILELFSNTDEWGRPRPGDSGAPAASVRGLRVEMHTMTSAAAASSAAGNPALEKYLEAGKLQPREKRIRLVELSVFDAGPGLAHWRLRQLGKSSPSVDDEFSAVADCLSKHFGTGNNAARGKGLDSVLRTLTGFAGFLRLRTGRLHLYRDFAHEPYEPDVEGTRPRMHHWGPSAQRDRVAPAHGTLLTLLFPLRYAA